MKLLQQSQKIQEKEQIEKEFICIIDSQDENIFTLSCFEENNISLINNKNLNLVSFPLTRQEFDSFIKEKKYWEKIKKNKSSDIYIPQIRVDFRANNSKCFGQT